jgi:uncharacterized protein YheU (UPF0270 family)
MANFVAVPLDRLPSDVLVALLEEFASRDGTDYGERECSLEQKVGELRTQLAAGERRESCSYCTTPTASSGTWYPAKTLAVCSKVE